MIPSIKPPFGPLRAAAAVASFVHRVRVEDVEQAYSRAFGVPYVLLLPSCRAGICWALQASIEKHTRVVCPVYTCMVVWEAVIRAGGKIHMVDTAEDCFLMDETALSKAQTGNYAIILCEIYGHTYDLSKIAVLASNEPVVRIVDMAMTVPTAKLFERLGTADFAVMSFGRDKCMNAGWGGMAFTFDKALADKVRKMRDSCLAPSNFSLLVRRSMKLIALNLSYEPMLYGFYKKRRNIRRSIRHRVLADSTDSTTTLIAERLISQDWSCPATKEWFIPTTYVERNLMLYNLRNAGRYCEQKKILAHRYHENFEGVAGIIRPDISSDILSHYTIRVHPRLRPLLKKRLYELNIDAGTRFFFPKSFSVNDYPNASRTASEVLNLPLDVRLTVGDVDSICRRVILAVKHPVKALV